MKYVRLAWEVLFAVGVLCVVALLSPLWISSLIWQWRNAPDAVKDARGYYAHPEAR